MIKKKDKILLVSALFILSLCGVFAVMDGNKKSVDNKKSVAIIKQDIINYLVNEANVQPAVAERLYNGLAKYQDVLCEYHTWLKTKRYPGKSEGAVVVQGYTALELAKLARGKLRPLSVYDTLIYLRTDPEEALKFIKSGFLYE